MSVRSNDVLNGSLDLVLRLCTHVDAVWRVLQPGREVRNFLLDPLSLDITVPWSMRHGSVAALGTKYTVQLSAASSGYSALGAQD